MTDSQPAAETSTSDDGGLSQIMRGIEENGCYVTHPKLSLYSFIVGVLAPTLIYMLGLLVLSIGILEHHRGEPAATSVIGALVAVLGFSVLSLWLPGNTRVVLDRQGFTVRKWWHNRRYEWRDTKRVAAVGGMYLTYGTTPAMVLVILHQRGFLGLNRRIKIMDVYSIRKAELASAMEQLRVLAACEAGQQPTAKNTPPG